MARLLRHDEGGLVARVDDAHLDLSSRGTTVTSHRPFGPSRHLRKDHRMSRAPLLLFLAVLGLAASVRAGEEEGWVKLFNGKDLAGWIQRGGKAQYTVENGEIVGASVPRTPNSFLCTKREYSDFILEL